MLPAVPIVFNMLNHQTHHRGQVHGVLTGLGKPSLELDFIYLRDERLDRPRTYYPRLSGKPSP